MLPPQSPPVMLTLYIFTVSVELLLCVPPHPGHGWKSSATAGGPKLFWGGSLQPGLLKQRDRTPATLQQCLDIAAPYSDWTNHKMRLFPLTCCYQATSCSPASECWACNYLCDLISACGRPMLCGSPSAEKALQLLVQDWDQKLI